MWLYIVGKNLTKWVISHSVVHKIAVVKALDPLVLGIKKKPVQFKYVHSNSFYPYWTDELI